MSDNIYKNNFHSANGKKAWHSKGETGKVGVFENGETVYGRMEEVQYELHPATFEVHGIKIPNKVNGIFRIENGKSPTLIGETKDRYVLKQPIEYIKEFDTLGKSVETLGFLGSNAEKLFITWNLPEIDIHGDVIELYGFVVFGFDGKFGNHLFVTSTRVVCQNTHNIAVAEAGKTNNYGRGRDGHNAVVTTKHNSKEHLETMGHWMRYVDSESQKQVDNIRSLFCKMEERPISVDEAHGLFDKVYFANVKDERSFIPPALAQKEKETVEDQKKKAQEGVDLAMSLFEGAGISISKTVFGAYNCVTEHQNHKIVSKKNDGIDSLLMGGRAKVMDTAFKVCREYVEVR